MQKYLNAIQDVKGNAVAGAAVAVYVYGTETLATIYSDNGVTPIVGSIVTTDSSGEFYFYAANGRYSLTVTAANFTTDAYSDISLFDPADAGAVSSANVTFLQAGTGAVSRTVQAKERDVVSVKDFGAVGDGVTDDRAAFNLCTGAYTFLPSPSASYKLSANWTPVATDRTIVAASDVSFSTSHPDYNNLIPYEAVPGPLWSQHVIRKDYGSSWAGTGNVFQLASFAKASVASVPIVALYGGAEAATSNSRAWRLNTSCFVSNATGIGIGYELNCGVLAAGGTSYGLVIASSGAAGQPLNAIQVDANETGAQFVDGVNVHFSDTDSRGCVTGSVYKITGGGGAASVTERFIHATGVKATVAEIDLPSLLVDPTVATGTVNRLRIKPGAAGVGPLLLPAGESSVDLNLCPRGTGSVGFYDSSLNKRFSVNSTGIGFFTTAPIAKPTVTGSKGANAALASLLSALAAYGLIIDSTT